MSTFKPGRMKENEAAKEEKNRIRHREYLRLWRQRRKDSKKINSSEEKEEERQTIPYHWREYSRAWRQGKNDSKGNVKNLEELNQKIFDDIQTPTVEMLPVKTEPGAAPQENVIDIYISENEEECGAISEENPSKAVKEIPSSDVNVNVNCKTSADVIKTDSSEECKTVAIQTEFLTILPNEHLLYHCPHCPALFRALNHLNDHMIFKGKTWLMEDHIRNPDAPRPPLPPNVIVTQVLRDRTSDSPITISNEGLDESSIAITEEVTEVKRKRGRPRKRFRSETEDVTNEEPDPPDGAEKNPNDDESKDVEEDDDGSTQGDASPRKRRRKKKDPLYEPPVVMKIPAVKRTLGLRSAKCKKPVKYAASDESEMSDRSDTEEEFDSEDSSPEEEPVKNDTDATQAPPETSKLSPMLVPGAPKQAPMLITVRNLPLAKNDSTKSPVDKKSEVIERKRSGERRVMESLQKNHLMRIGLMVEGRVSNLKFPETVHPAISRLRHRMLPKEDRQNMKAIEVVEKLCAKVHGMKDRDMASKSTVKPTLGAFAARNPNQVRQERPAGQTQKIMIGGVTPQLRNLGSNVPKQYVVRTMKPATSASSWIPQIVGRTTDSPVILRTIPQGVNMTTTSAPNGPIILRPISNVTGSGDWIPQIVSNSSGGQQFIYVPQKAAGLTNMAPNSQTTSSLLKPITIIKPQSGEWMPKILETSSGNVTLRNSSANARSSKSTEWSPQVSGAMSVSEPSHNQESLVPSLNIDLSVLSNCH